jgi:hypothetical protein
MSCRVERPRLLQGVPYRTLLITRHARACRGHPRLSSLRHGTSARTHAQNALRAMMTMSWAYYCLTQRMECTTGKWRIRAMRKLPVVPLCRSVASSDLRKLFWTATPNQLHDSPVPPRLQKDVCAIVTKGGAGCDGRGGVSAQALRGRLMGSRTANSCGPGLPTLEARNDPQRRQGQKVWSLPVGSGLNPIGPADGRPLWLPRNDEGEEASLEPATLDSLRSKSWCRSRRKRWRWDC